MKTQLMIAQLYSFSVTEKHYKERKKVLILNLNLRLKSYIFNELHSPVGWGFCSLLTCLWNTEILAFAVLNSFHLLQHLC